MRIRSVRFVGEDVRGDIVEKVALSERDLAVCAREGGVNRSSGCHEVHQQRRTRDYQRSESSDQGRAHKHLGFHNFILRQPGDSVAPARYSRNGKELTFT